MGMCEIDGLAEVLSEYWHCFTIEDAIALAEELVDASGVPRDMVGSVTRVVEGNPTFLQTQDGEIGNRYYISRRALHHWFVHLNTRLARAHVGVLGERQLISLANSLREDSRWSAMPASYLAYGHSTGLICPSLETGEFVFPLAHILSFLSKSNLRVGEEYLRTRYDIDSDTVSSTQSLTDGIGHTIQGLSRKQQDVIVRRNGLLQTERLTLERLGERWGVTRERIRQVEKQCWKRLWHVMNSRYVVAPLLFYIIKRKGSLVVTDIEASEVGFVAKCLNIPMSELPDTGLHILGMTNETSGRLESHPGLVYDLNALAAELQLHYGLILSRDDMLKVATALSPTLEQRMTKSHKVYISLRQIGRPEHYERIFEMYESLFPEDGMTAHNVHAILGRHEHGVVWIGLKGTYALQEWGYERPSDTLFHTVAAIVESKFAETGNPVPYAVIAAEVGKHRSIVRPTSVMLAAYCNPSLVRVQNDCLIPGDNDQTEGEIFAEELDGVLEQFEAEQGQLGREPQRP